MSANAILDSSTSVSEQINAALKRANGLDKWAPAYISAVRASRDALKNATNPHLRNTYADLSSVLDAVRDAFLTNELWMVQSPGKMELKGEQPYMSLHGLLVHSSGQSVAFQMELPAFTLNKQGETILNPQTAGSAISYARRYMWAAVAGITQVDDDADEASYRKSEPEPPVTTRAVTRPLSTPKAAPVPLQTAKADDDLAAKIKAAKSLDELKPWRAAAQAAGGAVAELYMSTREQLLK